MEQGKREPFLQFHDDRRFIPTDRDNIRRLAAGTEPKIGQGKKAN